MFIMNNQQAQEAILTLPNEPKDATKHILNLLIQEVWPKIIKIQESCLSGPNFVPQIESTFKLKESLMLSCNHLKKCVLNLLTVLKLEFQNNVILQESRHCMLEQLTFCVKRLNTIESILLKHSFNLYESQHDLSAHSVILDTPMYFVTWIDHIFELLVLLSDLSYKTDYKESPESLDIWTNELIDCIQALHVSVDELLLSAMTLCKYSLTNDQPAVTARCQVVLREMKNLVNELVSVDFNNAYKITKDALKLPIKPSNLNILIDVLKDALYLLEANTNTALLGLLIHCCSNSISPVDILKDHLGKTDAGICSCGVNNLEEITENCQFVKEFDLYNERLLQIGNFAVSCSSDNNRILSLRSGLMNLESYDPYLVPALSMSSHSLDSVLLVDMWKKEMSEIIHNVYLIVDPMAFSQKCKEIMHSRVLNTLKKEIYDNVAACSIINIGSLLYEFFDVYNRNEPDALVHVDSLLMLMKDLEKVTNECKIVSNMLSISNQDFKYNVKASKSANNSITATKFFKRLRLLYTVVTKIDDLFHAKENDDQFFNVCDGDPSVNVTHTIHPKLCGTYTKNSPRKLINNITRSIFARSSNNQFPIKNMPLSRLTQNMKCDKYSKELSFCKQFEDLFNNVSKFNYRENGETLEVTDKYDLNLAIEESIFSNRISKKNRSSLRKAVLNKHKSKPLQEQSICSDHTKTTGSFMDSKTTLQITDILNQINDISSALSRANTVLEETRSITTVRSGTNRKPENTNILTININETHRDTSKHVWNIPVGADTVEACSDSVSANVTISSSQVSDITTLERINDLDLLECRLSHLKSLYCETDI